MSIRLLDRRLKSMSDRKPLSDAEIADLLGDGPKIQPPVVIADHDADLQERFLKSIEHWLIRKVAITEVQANLITPKTLPGFRCEFVKFVAAATESHETWEFCSPQSDWDRLAGRWGFALVKDGRVTHAIVVMES
jgi:hypothetical protein